MIRRKAKQRRGLPAGAIAQLRFGRGFGAFGPGFGPWTETSIAAARAGWRDERIRQAALSDQARRRGLGRTFGELAFGPDGKSGLLKSIADLPEVFAVLAKERSRATAEAMKSLRPEILELPPLMITIGPRPTRRKPRQRWRGESNTVF